MNAPIVGSRGGEAPADPTLLFADAGLERDGHGVLRLSGVSLDSVAADVGTPAYVYHAAPIRERFQALTSAFGAIPHKIHYAVKANSNLAVLHLLKELGAGADIVSGGELRRALRAGFDPSTIVFSGVGKSEEELEAAVATRIGSVNIEAPEEMTLLERIAERRSDPEPIRLGIRVNPDVAAETHPYITTGAGGIKFGVPAEQVPALAKRIAVNPRFTLVSIAMHLGSQLLDAAPFARGVAKLTTLLDELIALGITTITTLDAGGGLGIRYRDETPLGPDVLAAQLVPLVAGRGLTLHLEPGRFLVGSAGLLLTKVLYRKRSGGKDFVIVDASMTDLVRPSHYQAYHAMVETTRRHPTGVVADIVGPVCETGDFLALDRFLPDVQPGDRIAIMCAGAYGAVMASNYNTRPRAPEVLVDGGRYAVARPRETIDSLFGDEVVEPLP